jgi:hypothetical protein
MMNERIQELMGQTLDEKFAGTWSAMDMQDLTKFADRFSELIVQECATVIEQNLFQGIGWNTSRAVKRHFGIGEEE